ncbi:MAG: peptidase family [Chitinophagaceae bacterium]|nr:peptidase family [Chitinophagaceae bacterium]
MVVLSSIYRNDPVFKRGTIITAINGVNSRQLLDSMFRLISTDGYADNFKSQVVSFNFPVYYVNTFGISKEFTINYIDSTGLPKTTVLPAYTLPKRDTSKRRVPVILLPRPTRKERKRFELLTKRNFSIDADSKTAFIQLNTFSGGKLSDFYYSAFKKLKKDSIQNLVIDLRQNGGGSIGNSTLLTRYLINQPFHVADTVAAVSRRMRYGSYIHPSWLYWLSMNLFTHQESDGRFHMRILEKHKYKPKKKNHFNGNVFIIQGGYTFSAATMFISSVLHQSNVTTVGEETGGGYYGNTAVHLPAIVLPNSRIRVILPLFHMVFDSTREKTGRGIFPKVMIPPSSAAIKAGTDSKVEAVRQIIKEQR